MNPNESWLRRRWFEIRLGHQFYFAFLFGFSNFIILFYTFIVVPYFAPVALPLFVLIFLIAYLPVVVLVGRQHIKRQFRIDGSATVMNNPVWVKHLEDTEKIMKALNIK